MHTIDQQDPGSRGEGVGLDFRGPRINLIDARFNIDGGAVLVATLLIHPRTTACRGTPRHGPSAASTGSPSGSKPAAWKLASTNGSCPMNDPMAGTSPTDTRYNS